MNNNNTIKPPIKWPGGKSKEFERIKEYIPSFNRYVEPFFGGGAVFFKLRPKNAIINDISSNLMTFYSILGSESQREEFRAEMNAYVTNWEKIPIYISLFEKKFILLYNNYHSNQISQSELKNAIEVTIREKENEFNGLFKLEFSLSNTNLIKKISTNLSSKVARTSKIEKTRGKISDSDLEKNIETGFRSGFYMHFRDVLNNLVETKYVSEVKKIANYYFIREFCYGSMFRYNAKGHFNIPYGGIAYNKKDFSKKVNDLFNDDLHQLLKDSVIENTDFENVFSKYSFDCNDFIFVDPPYDTDFSDYEDNSFDFEDQKRLAETLKSTKAKFMLLIKDTPFVRTLYQEGKGINILSFDKKYQYNVKGRNDRDVTHLLIYNYNL